MIMLYIIYSKQKDLINREIKRISKNRLKEINEFTFIKIDAENTTYEEIAFECSALPLGYDNKLVVVNYAPFLKEAKKKKNADNDYASLKETLLNLDDNIDVIFTLNEDEFTSKHELSEVIRNNAKIISFKPITKDDWPKYVEQYFIKRDANITKDAVNELAKRTEGDLSRFHNEANKLMLYTNNVTLVDIVSFVSKPLEENAFLLTEALLKGKISTALEIYSDLKIKNFEPVALLPVIASQFRFINQVKYLSDCGLNESSIASNLRANPYRVRKSMQVAYKISQNKINNVLDKIYQLDYTIKSGQIDRFVGFELFLINFNN